MQHLRLLAWTIIASGFFFGLPERFIAGDYFSVSVASVFLVPLFVLFPYDNNIN